MNVIDHRVVWLSTAALERTPHCVTVGTEVAPPWRGGKRLRCRHRSSRRRDRRDLFHRPCSVRRTGAHASESIEQSCIAIDQHCQDETVTLRVMTWNLWWRFGPFEQRLPAIVSTIRSADPDIVCLQEVWSDHQRDVADELAAATGMQTVRTDPVMWNGESFGNAILSRWPIERVASVALPNAAGEPGHRRVVAAHVMTPWGPWPIASTHLDHRFDASATRQGQVRRLLELGIEWRGDPSSDLPLIVGADLNAVSDSDELRLLTGRRDGVEGIVFSDVWAQVGNGPGHTWRADNPYVTESAWPNRRLDSLLVSWPRPKPVGNPTRVWNTATGPTEVGTELVWASDHAAVVADFVTP